MTDKSNTSETTDQTTSAADDQRFEVKWRKKGGSSAKTPEVPRIESSEATDVERLQRELETERQRVAELQDRWQRAAADLANFRKRTEQEKGDMQKLASMLLVQQLLPVLDNFDRALASIPGNLQMLTWIQGVMLIERHLRAILEQQGVAAIEAQGQQFNTYYHEAVSERETEEAAPGTVLQEYQKGYTMHGTVIRPALVEVAKKPEAGTEEAPAPVSEEKPAPDSTDVEQADVIAEETQTENVGP
jgi:molecular chaperone GrpE